MSDSTNKWKDWPRYIQQRVALEEASPCADVKSMTFEMTDAHSVKAKDVVGWIYGVLTTLDGKASALMRLNGVLIAAAAFLLGSFGRQDGTILSTTPFDKILIIWSALLSAVSIAFCLFVVNVSWNFLGRITNTGTSFDLSKEIEALDKASTFRQCAYRGAWWISLVASVGFLAEFLLQTFYITYSIICGNAPWG